VPQGINFKYSPIPSRSSCWWVKGAVSGTTTVYIGNYYEWTGSTSTSKKYYYAGTVRVAVRTGTGGGTTGLNWLLGDHLGSTNRIANGDGSPSGPPITYKPWGETRAGTSLTTFKFTGQRQESALGGTEGLYYYGARWYDSYLNRWTSPDPIIPDPYNPADWDRFSYVRNNPVNFTDPTGHKPCIFECTNGEVDPIKLADGIKNETNTRRYWDGLDKDEQKVLANGNWDRGSFNDFMSDQTSPADLWHDPLTYILIFVGGGGTAKAALPWLVQPATNTSAVETPDLDTIANDIEEWVGQGEKPISFLNKAGDFIMRNAENTRRFQAHFNDYFPHESPHFHLDYLNEAGEWITERIFPWLQ
jgi:RHS repeat-associated protein